tara:strand:+ start:728 stop:1873 length:1146 start_codon:yes stop_codon:yes gene_type:complete
MATITTLSQTEFDRRKAEAVTNDIIRREVHIADFEINQHSLKVDGVNIPMTEHAQNRLLILLRIPKAFAKRLKDQFGENALGQIVSLFKNSGKRDTFTLIVDPKQRKITNILPAGYGAISNEGMIELTARYLDQYNLGVTHFGSDSSGTTINAVSDQGMFKIPGMKNEVFQTGVSFINTPERGLEVTPFLNRLVCANGMTSRGFSEKYALNSLTDDNIKRFNDHMLQLASTGFQPQGFIDKIRTADMTHASLAEVKSAIGSVMNTGKFVSYEYAQRYIPLERSLRQYQELGCDTNLLTNKQLSSADSGLSVWELVNGMTNFASNQTKFSINDNQMGALMVRAGGMLTKKNYDLSDRLEVNPFAKSKLLSKNQSDKMMGNLN